ncbi:MAG: hypothetical protein A3F41_00460 [Coxiella sp. RIFCSPHIGHO2_12_FULL_44_14]|nr:MAG: hypothetical protein A3F41_00460 [Coxiella sp. RIFCSPHIGHO2_12_FULL_44_14]
MPTAAIYNKTEKLQNIRLRDNLLRLMKERDTNMTLIFRHTGVPITTIQRICKDPTANPTLASLIPIAEYFSITLAQLIGEEPLPNSAANCAPQHWFNVPIISWQQATHWQKFQNQHREQRFVTTEIHVGNNAFALEIPDNHHDNFHKGSLVIIDSTLPSTHGDYVISHKKGSPQVSLNQVLLHEGDIYLKPTNSEFKTTLMSEAYMIVGVVVQVRMNLK